MDRHFVQRKAALTLLRLFRKSPDSVLASDWAPKIIDLLNHANAVWLWLESWVDCWLTAGCCTIRGKSNTRFITIASRCVSARCRCCCGTTASGNTWNVRYHRLLSLTRYVLTETSRMSIYTTKCRYRGSKWKSFAWCNTFPRQVRPYAILMCFTTNKS